MFKSLFCGFFIGIAAAVSMAQGGPRADEVSTSDGRAVRAVVEAQLKALATDDSVRAFSYASPAIKKQFGNAATFFEMVRRTYPMLIRPVAISFFRPESGDGVITQGVQFRDREGNIWRAIYELQRQPDKSWRINGCAVTADDDSSTT